VKQATLHLVCGLPGAGKTTFSTKLETELGAVRFCPDQWIAALQVDLFDEAFRYRLEQKMIETASSILRQGGNVIIEFGSWGKSERAQLRDMAQHAGARVHLYWLEASVSELGRRVRARNGPDVVLLDEAHLQAISDRIERPDEAEGAIFDQFEWIGSA
jgi:predicted kinase